MYQTLYRKWRPKSFDDVFGQEHITKILRYEIEEKKTSHAYLFCGSRGIGKTTCAKILAKAINCEHPVNGNPCGECPSCRGIENGSIIDVIEMDAASNNGVNDIRDIKDNLDFVPAEVSKRVYIIDEVHMLSISAFNALLKTLEEPPEHAVFILATTELSKIPPTILSRCQRFDFRRIDSEIMVKRLRQIADAETIRINDEALYLIARVANGGMRDAIGMLELCAGSAADLSLIDEHMAASLIGVSDLDTMYDIVDAVLRADYEHIFSAIDKIAGGAVDFDAFWSNLLLFYRDLLVIKTTKDPTCFLELPPSQLAKMKALADRFEKSVLLYHFRVLDDTFASMQANGIPKRASAETGLVKMCDCKLDVSADALLTRIETLEGKLSRGDFSIKTAPKEDASLSESVPEQQKEKEDVLPPDIPIIQNIPTVTFSKYNKWQDVVLRCADQGGVYAMLKKCRAMISSDNSQICVLAPDRITLRTVSAEPAVKSLLYALNAEAGEPKYTENDLEIRVSDGDNEEERDLFDELMNDE